MVEAVGAVVLYQVHQGAEAVVGLHQEIAAIGLEDFIMLDVTARPHCENTPTPTTTHRFRSEGWSQKSPPPFICFQEGEPCR